MKRWLLPVAAAVALVACGEVTTTTPADAGNPTQVKVITDWSGNEQGYRVVEIPVKDSVTRVCIERLVKYGGGLSDNPKGTSVSISCETQPR